jgi:hypothetical protein
MAQSRQDIINAAIAGPKSGNGEGRMPPEERVRRAIAIPRSDISEWEGALISTIKENPQEVVNMLNKRDFNAKIVDGEAVIEQPDGRFVPFNKPGFQLSDLTLFAPEVIETVAGGFAAGSKTLGALAAPFTGGGSLGAGMAAAGAATGGFEALRQGAGVAAGVREGFDVGRIGKQAAIGAGASGLLGIAGKAIGKGAEGLRKVFVGGPRKLKVDVGGVKEAGKLLKAPMTPAQTSTIPGVRATEEALHVMKGGIGGLQTRAKMAAAERRLQEVAGDILNVKARGTASEIGDKFRGQLVDAMEKTMKKSEKLYSEVQSTLKEVPAWSAENLSKNLDDMVDTGKLRLAGPEAKGFIKQIKDELKNVTNVEDLKLLRTSVGKRVNTLGASDELKEAADRTYALISKARTEAFEDAIKAAKAGGEDAGVIESAVKKLKRADQLYRSGVQRVQKGIMQAPVKGKIGALRQSAAKLEKINEEQLIKRLFPTGSANKVKSLSKLSPEAAQTARESIVGELKDKVLSAGKGGEHLNIPTLTAEIDKWSPEVAEFLLGKDGHKKAKAIGTFYRSLPRDLNPSGSFKELFRLAATNPLGAAGTLGAAHLSSMSMSALNILLRKQKEAMTAAAIGGLSAKARESEKRKKKNKANKIILEP